VESTDKPRALLAAFAEVPGPTAAGVRGEQLLLGFSSEVEFDALTLKGASMTHIQRVGAARMMRVPVPDVSSGEAGMQAAFRERLATYRRALTRQLEAERYDVVLCLDLFSAATAAPLLHDAKLVIDVADVPSTTFAARWSVSAGDAVLRQQWEAAEKSALRAARLLMVPSRLAGRALSERADPRLLRAAPRLVDTRRFTPPSVELSLDGARTVAVHGGREPRRATATADLLQRLARRVPDARLLLLGHPGRTDAALVDALARRDLNERVVLVDVATPVEVAQALQTADVVVVPAGGAGDGWGIPHRVLEAMACERAVVVGGTEAALKDAVQNGVHARIVDGAADDVACAVRDVLDDDRHRRALAREGRRQALRFDFVGRSPEVAQLLTEATGVSFVAAVPPLEEDVASGSSPPVAAPAAVSVRPPPANVVVAVPPAAVAAEYSEGAAAMPVRRPPTRPTSSPSHVRSVSLSVPDGDGDGAVVDTWSGETVLDDGRGAAIAEAERVKAALLHTASGERERSSPTTTEASTSGARPMRSQGPRSVSLVIDALDGEDDWSRDTIADASPIEPSAPPPTRERIAEAAPLPRSMMLEVASEMTAEDDDG
jgi:glycosyltransferase involved in cell wall biosynthesis